MVLRKIRLRESSEGTEADLFPDIDTLTVLEREPTKANENILVDIAKIGGPDGRTVPKKVLYKGRSTEEVLRNADLLFEKAYTSCPMCQRKAEEIKSRLRAIVNSDRSDEDKRDLIRKEIERARANVERSKQQQPRKVPSAASDEPATRDTGNTRPGDQVYQNTMNLIDSLKGIFDVPKNEGITLPWD